MVRFGPGKAPSPPATTPSWRATAKHGPPAWSTFGQSQMLSPSMPIEGRPSPRLRNIVTESTRPPTSQSARSSYSNLTERSEASRGRLARLLRQSQLQELLWNRLQMEGTAVGHTRLRDDFIRQLVGKEVAHMMEAESLAAALLPRKFDKGLLPGSDDQTRLATPALRQHLRKSAASIKEALVAAEAAEVARRLQVDTIDPGPEQPPTPPPENTHNVVLPRMPVCGRTVPLDQVLRDKLLAKYAGGSQPTLVLAREFKSLDLQRIGTISVDAFRKFFKQFNISLKPRTVLTLMDKLGVRVAGSQIDYLGFVDAIIPTSYPPGGKYVQSIAQRSRSPGRLDPDQCHLQETLRRWQAGSIGAPVGVQTVEQFEVLLRDKLQQRTSTGGGELVNQFKEFDRGGKGHVAPADFSAACALYNLYPSEVLMQQLIERYADDTGTISYLNFVNIILGDVGYNRPRTDKATLTMFKEKLLGSESMLRKTFRRLDKDQSGYLDIDELMVAVKELNLDMIRATMEDIISETDADGDGQMSYEEFVSFLADYMVEDPGKEDPNSACQYMVGGTGIPGLSLPWTAHGLSTGSQEHPTGRRRPESAESVPEEQEDEELADEYKAYEFSGVSWNTEKSTSGVVDGLTGETETLAVDGEELAAKNAFRLDLAQIIRDKVAQRSAKSTPHHFRKNFHMMDKDGQKWQLTRAEFKEFLAKVNINLDEEGLQQVLQTFDEDNNGTVDYDEFVKVAVPPNFVKDDCGRYQGVTGITHNREFAQSGLTDI
jgi:Ca2+-binding EF-hand superfamily protein